jgi:apolipoprotein N-acyltransferase
MASGTATLATNKVELMAVTPAPASTPPSRPATVWLAPLASAALLYLSFFPVAWGWLGWVALVPWLCLVRLPGHPRGLYVSAWLGALTFYFPVLQWARVADPRMYATWAFLAVGCSAYLVAALALLRRLDRRTRLPLTVTLPVVWVAVEYLRWGVAGGFASLVTGSHQHDYPGGFAWYQLGHTQHDFLEAIQIADLGGAYAVSFVVALANAALFEILYVRDWFRRAFLGDAPARFSRSAVWLNVAVTGCVVGAALGYGAYRLGEETTRPGPKVAFVQCNVDQRLRNVAFAGDRATRDEARRSVRDHFRDLIRQSSSHRPDLIVTPETSYPGSWTELAPGLPSMVCRQLGQDISAACRAPVLLGMNAYVVGLDGVERAYNSAVLLDGGGAWRGRYDKVHRVPFGEYIPLRRAMPWLGGLAPYDFDYAVEPGEAFTRFTLPGDDPVTFGVMICYEDTDPAMARPYVAEQTVDFLLNISNDGWFDGTSEHDQHLAQCRFRAVETRRSVGRAVNMGISALVDPNGRVLAPDLVPNDDEAAPPVWVVPDGAASLPVSRWAEYKKVAGVLVGRVPIDGRASRYARLGDVFAMGCAALLLAGLGVTVRSTKKEPV